MADSSQNQDQAYGKSSGQLRLVFKLLEIGTDLRLTFLETHTQRAHQLFYLFLAYYSITEKKSSG